MKILFVCKYNRFRSKVAEFYYNKLSKKKAKSAGIIEVNVPLTDGESQRRDYLREKYEIIVNSKSRGVKVSDLLDADKIVIVADNVPKQIFNNKKWRNKVVVWKVPDEPAADKRNIDKSVKLILNKVQELVKRNGNS